MIQFYSEGFFGYGQPGDYVPYGLDFFIPILLLIGLAVLIVLMRKKIRNLSREKTIRFVLAFLIIVVEMSYYWRVLYVGVEGRDETSLLTKLPMQVCEWGAICAAFMLMSLSDTLFGINYFITFVGAGIAIFVPQTVIESCGPTYYRYYQFWGEHALPILATVYAIAVHKKKPRYRDLWVSYGLLCLLTVPATFANMAFPEANYLYLRLDIPFMPDSYPLRVVIYSVIILALFHLLYAGWVLVSKLIMKRKTKAVEA